MDEPCPCGSTATYDTCCGPIHRHADDAPTARSLMRARYSAFTRRDDEFLRWTWHPDHRPDVIEFPGDEEWEGLQIVESRGGGPDDERGTVEFIARFRTGGVPRMLHEVSRFVRLDGRWVYFKGRDVGQIG